MSTKTFILAISMVSITAIIATPALADEAAAPLLHSPKAKVEKLDFDASMQRIPTVSDRVEFMLDQKRIDGVLENLYVNRVLANSARELKLDQDPLIARQLILQNEQFLAKLRVDKVKQDVKLPDFMPRAQEIYKVEGDRFKVPAEVRAMHILIDTKSRSRPDALKKVQEVHAMVVAQAKDFAALASEFSDDPSVKTNKGDLGFFPEGRMAKPFSDAAFALSTPGQVTEPVETIFGFHIIKLVEKKAGSKKSFDNVKAEILKSLQDEYVDAAVADYMNTIRGDKELKVNTAAIAKLKPVIIKPAAGPKPPMPPMPQKPEAK